MNIVVYVLFVSSAVFAEGLLQAVYPPNVCLTERCYVSGMEMSNSLASSPSEICENFYKFSCAGWMSSAEKPPSEVLWNHWQAAAHAVNARIRRILEDRSVASSEALQKGKHMYRACLDSKKNYANELVLLCSSVGGWPMVQEHWNRTDYNWLLQVAEMTRYIQIFPLLKLHVDVDHDNAMNYVLYIDPGTLILPNYILEEPELHIEQLVRYKEWIVSTVKDIFPKKELPKLSDDVDDLITFEIELAKLMAARSARQTLRVKELSTKIRVDWTKTFKLLFSGTGIRVKSSDSVTVSLAYLERLMAFLARTNTKIIANYMTWYMVKDLARDVSSNMRYLNFQINSAILGVEEDYSVNYECAAKASQYFNYPLAIGYSEAFIESDTVEDVKRMAVEIKYEFIRLLKVNKWLSKTIKRKAIDKVTNVRVNVGYPERLRNGSAVENIYKDIVIGNNHFLNVLKIRKQLAKHNLQKLSIPAEDKWPDNLFDVNAYYNPLQNSIIISMGLLDAPFFRSGTPEVLNYGALGSLIGHELSHALDTIVTEPSKIDGRRRWWTADLKTYQSKLACFKSRYDNYNVDGHQTMMENVADNVGLELSLRAYHRKDRFEGTIPFLENFTEDQLFFVSYAQMWCEVSGRADEFLLKEEHAPVQYRVQGVVTNNVRFHKSFNCTTNAALNKCYLW